MSQHNFDGSAFASREHCPHRINVPVLCRKLQSGEIPCCYHVADIPVPHITAHISVESGPVHVCSRNGIVFVNPPYEVLTQMVQKDSEIIGGIANACISESYDAADVTGCFIKQDMIGR